MPIHLWLTHNTKKRQPIILTEGVEQDWLNSGVNSAYCVKEI